MNETLLRCIFELLQQTDMRQLKGKTKESAKEKRERKKEFLDNKENMLKVALPAFAGIWLVIAVLIYLFWSDRPGVTRFLRTEHCPPIKVHSFSLLLPVTRKSYLYRHLWEPFPESIFYLQKISFPLKMLADTSAAEINFRMSCQFCF